MQQVAEVTLRGHLYRAALRRAVGLRVEAAVD